jgi:hypothetical protein
VKAAIAPAAVNTHFARLFKELSVRRADQPLITDCLMLGLARFHEHVYGAPARRSVANLASRIREPYIFGFGAVEVARNDAIPLDIRIRFADTALQSFDATTEYGIPHGLPILASFLARAGVLEPDVMRTMLITAGFAGAMFDDWQLDEVQRLCQWLIDRVDMPKAERLWWLWQLSINCEDAKTARQVGEWQLGHADVGHKTKVALCRAWLDDMPPGEPPPQWEALQSLLQGDVRGFVRHAAEAGFEADGTISSEEIEADYDAALDALLDEAEEDNDPPAMPLHLLRRSLVGPMGELVNTPSVLKHLALINLVRYGVEPAEICQTYLGEERRPHGATYNLGVAEVIRAEHARIPTAVLRRLVARGVSVGGVATRRAFYQLGVDIFGEKFRKNASQDGSKSIRDWAKRKSKAKKR